MLTQHAYMDEECMPDVVTMADSTAHGCMRTLRQKGRCLVTSSRETCYRCAAINHKEFVLLRAQTCTISQHLAVGANDLPQQSLTVLTVTLPVVAEYSPVMSGGVQC